MPCNNKLCNAYCKSATDNCHIVDYFQDSGNLDHRKPVEACGNYISLQDNVVNINSKDDRAITITTENMLLNAIQGVRQEPRWNKKALLIFLDEEEGYVFRTMCAGFPHYSEIISLLQLTIIEQASLMRFPTK